MPGDGFEGLEAMIGAIANLGGEKEPALADARCPQCNAADFVQVSDLYYDTIRRAEREGLSESRPGQGGMSDERIIRKLRPPRRRSAISRALMVAVPAGLAAYLVYARFGEVAGEFGIMGAIVITLIAFMTRTRHLSDLYYEQRHTWDHLYICRKCGQLVSG